MYHRHHHLPVFPTKILRLSTQSACTHTAAGAVRVSVCGGCCCCFFARSLSVFVSVSCVFVSQVVHHSDDVSRFLPVQRAQHSVCGSDLHQPLHRHQRQRSHIRHGALWRPGETPTHTRTIYWKPAVENRHCVIYIYFLYLLTIWQLYLEACVRCATCCHDGYISFSGVFYSFSPPWWLGFVHTKNDNYIDN